MVTGASPPCADGSPWGEGALATSFILLTRLVGDLRREFGSRLAEEDWVVAAGVRPPTMGILSVVAHLGPISQKEVGDLIGVHASDVVEMMDLVEAQGWVSRDRDPADRRRYSLTITDEGREVLRRFKEIAEAAEDTVLAPLAPAERAALNDLVAKALDGLRPSVGTA